jgi:hypothetical protein
MITVDQEREQVIERTSRFFSQIANAGREPIIEPTPRLAAAK